jgi:hypothetical protein
MTCFGASSLVAGLSAAFLAKKAGALLPYTIADVERHNRADKWLKRVESCCSSRDNKN